MVWHPPRETRQVLVLCGGDSPEREISLASGQAAVEALSQRGYRVDSFDPAEGDLAEVAWCQFDCCVLALHGGAGEDGRLQRKLEMLRVAYTGSGPAASRLAMSKSASKERFAQAGVPTKPYVMFHVGRGLENLLAQVAPLGFPLVVKPDGGGSSLGVGIANSPADLDRAVDSCRRWEAYAVAEPRIVGREFTVALIGRRALPVLEIRKPGQLFDYSAKYGDDRVVVGPPRDCPELVARLEAVAVAAAEALGTRGLARVDLMADDEQRVWVLEVNTVPGLTSHSLAPRAAQLAGLDLADLCEWMVADCLHAESAK